MLRTKKKSLCSHPRTEVTRGSISKAPEAFSAPLLMRRFYVFAYFILKDLKEVIGNQTKVCKRNVYQ